MGRKISLVALSAILSFVAIIPASAEDSGTFYVELVGPDEVVGEPEPQIYGPVRSNDTLWAIASLNRPSRSVSVYQMMYAILQKNPQAFNKGDVNSIISGSFLTLPTAEEVDAVNHQMAVNALGIKPKPVKPKVVAAPKTASSPVMASQPTVDAAALERTEHNLDSLRDKLETRIDELEQLRRQEFDVLKQQMDQSSQQMIGLAEVNHRMKMRIQELSDELAAIRDELNENRKNQTQILQLLEKPKVDVVESKPSGMSEFFSSPLNIGLAIFIPILLLALVITLVLRRKAKQALEEQDKEMAESTISLMDDEDEFSKLFSENLDPEEQSEIDLSNEFADEPDLSVEDLSPASSIDETDDLEPELEEASFEDFASSQQVSEPEIATEQEPLSSLDDVDDLVPSLEGADADSDLSDTEDDPNAVISADDLAAALSLEDDQDLFDTPETATIEEEEELSFEEALKQQQAMEAELSSLAEQDDIDLENIDLSSEFPEPELSPEPEQVAEPSAEIASDVADEQELAGFDLGDEQVDLADIELADPTLDEAQDLDGSFESDKTDLPLDVDLANHDLENSVESSEPESNVVAIDSAADASADDIDSMFANFSEDIFKQGDELADEGELPSRSDIEDKEFVDIDKLLSDADEPGLDEHEPYDKPSLDFELDSFPDVLPQGDDTDVDMNAELASKLDLARAYLEIDDQDGAKKILQEVMVSDDAALKKQAEDLLARFS